MIRDRLENVKTADRSMSRRNNIGWRMSGVGLSSRAIMPQKTETTSKNEECRKAGGVSEANYWLGFERYLGKVQPQSL